MTLTGQHTTTDCRQCHPTLVFSEARSECISCHADQHQSTAGADCARCHNTYSWLVSNINEIHQLSRFPLVGVHKTAGWKPATFNHNNFPLTLGHSGPTCAECHKGNYTTTSTDCYACHIEDYNESLNPGHRTLCFSTVCTGCHSKNPEWKPATYRQHDTQFPTNSGKHHGEWNSCSDCHTNSSNYGVFSCIICHEHNKADMDDEHVGEVNGYSYNSAECFRCHPRGNSD